MTKKHKIEIERGLNSKSEGLIWRLIGTAEGLSSWMADKVEQDDDTLTFSWGKPWETHETRQAKIIESKKGKLLRIKWLDDPDEDAYTELRLERLDISQNYLLTITDFAEDGEDEQYNKMWYHDLDRLRLKTGI